MNRDLFGAVQLDGLLGAVGVDDRWPTAAAAATTTVVIDELEPELAAVIVTSCLDDLQHRRGRAGKVAEEAVRAMEAEVLGPWVGQRDRKLIGGPDRVAVGRAGDR
jgi:hypothetical protein